jgi:hypothetical protein
MARIDVVDAIDLAFPLRLDPQVPGIRGLFRRAKRQRWDPAADVPWDEVHAERYSEDVRWAARVYWSGRAWGEYGAVAESPALQLRYDADALPADLSLFWAMRTQEEARHAEASAMFAEAMGGYLEQAPPANRAAAASPEVAAQPAVAATPYLGTRARALDPDLPVEATIAGLVCIAEQVVYDIFLGLIRHLTNPAAKRIFQLIVRDEVRHCEFGWLWLEQRASDLSAATRDACTQAMTSMVADIELGGYRAPWLSPHPDVEAVRRERLSFDAGLGGVAAEVEGPDLVRSVQKIRERAERTLNIHLPVFEHPLLGRF